MSDRKMIVLGIFGIVAVIGAYFFGRRSAQLKCCQECHTQLSSYATALQYERALRTQSPTQRKGFEIQGFGRDLDVTRKETV